MPPHKTQSQPADKKQSHDTRAPEDVKDGDDRASLVGRSDEDEDEVDVDDIVEEIDLDTAPSGDGPDA